MVPPGPGWRRKARRVVGGAINVWVARVMNARRRGPAVTPLGLEAYRALAAPTALDTARLLAGRSNPERARLLETVLDGSDFPVTRHPYRTVEGAGVNLVADIGRGDRVLLLAGHHDAVPGSPGANDNAAAVGILLALAARLRALPPRRLTVRLAFFGDEERGMLGSRVYVRSAPLEALLGVVSLELCGIGDSLALWDVTPALADTPMLRAWIGAAEGLGYRRDETFHLAEPVPFFGSDHRPFADRGVPAVGLTVVPTASADALRAFIYGGVRGILVPPARRPPPFTTYHTADDRPETLEPPALARALDALEALVRVLDGG
jgi:Zn-dependent M28 family amino/carboxypeptidase